MEWIRRIVKTPIEPEDKDVFWLDISVPNYAVLKYYENGEWKIVRHSEDGIAYILPVGGIPYSDLSQDVKNRIDLAKEQSDWNQNNASAVDYIKNKPNVAAKADKVEGATAGNLASLDAEGNITDSGISKDFIEDNYQHLYHCTLQEVLNPKDGDICIVPVSYNNIPITGIDDSNIFNFTSVNRKVKWRVTNGAEEWFFFRWISDSEEVITTPNLPENITGFPIEGIVDITNSTGEAALIWDTEFRSSVQYLTLYDVVPETAYLYVAQDWVKLEDLNKKGPDNVQQIYNSPLSEVTNPKEGDICVPPPMLTPYPIPTEYSEDYYDIPVDSQEVIITKKTDRPVDRWSETEFTITGYTKAGIDDYGTNLDALEMAFPYTHHFHFMPGAGNAAFMTIFPRDICEYLEFSRIASVPYIYHNGEWIQYVQLSAEEKASLELNIKHALSVAEEAYHLPDGGIPSNDLSSSVRESLNKANTAYQKPYTGITATDIADGVIPDVSNFITKAVDDLVNYYTKTQTYTKEEVQQIVSSLSAGAFIPVAELPVASADTYGLKIYLVPSTDPQTQNVKDEFITIRSGSEGAYTYSWEQIGSTAIDLSDYATKDELPQTLVCGAHVIPQPYSETKDVAETAELFGITEQQVRDLFTGKYKYIQFDGVILTVTVTNNDSSWCVKFQDPFDMTEYTLWGMTIAVGFLMLIGTRLQKDSAVLYTPQNLSDVQKRQARDNIDAKRITTLVIERTWTYARYQVYAKNGDQQSWATTPEYANQISKGDIFTIKATISDRGNCEAYIFVQAVSDPPYASNSIPAKCLITSSNKITQDVTALSDLTDDATHRLVTDTEKSEWNAKSDFSGSYDDLSNKPTIPDVSDFIEGEDYSGVAPVLVDPSNYYTKAETEELVETPVAATQPVGGFLPNVIYDLGELTGSVTFALATPASNAVANPYQWTFEAGSTAPTITWPTGLTWLGGNAPTINANKHYEIIVRNGYANCLEF